ncbi:LysR family transcriptional regulator [Azospirillum sp. BE72]|uniref:LysR family transcriptional regulator n=1 Tax=Azospirillum sp. BE72 TaxID=2817776 RepID=UPI00285BAC02|nr:LysR family transcriptional regulator [Azospirillum sp. BE72]MDR6773287.1 DNA-binding transcriptional LysR family regulator [Azospirillum sp. BE72]
MDLRHLQHFNVLAETGSLHQAARRLGLGQPALSQSIRSLEADVGTSLVVRSPNGTRLTRAGDAFLNEIRLVLAALDRAIHIAKLAVDTPAPLRLGITPDVTTRRLAELLREYRQDHHNGGIIIIDGSTAHLLSLLNSGFLDLALFPITAINCGVESAEVLWKEELYLALPTSHPLASEPSIDLRWLTELPVISKAGQDPDAATRSLLEGCLAAKISPQVTATMQHTESRLTLVAAGFGLTALPASGLGGERDGIIHRPTRPSLYVGVAAAWPTSGQTVQARRFLDMARTPITTETHPPEAQHAAPE